MQLKFLSALCVALSLPLASRAQAYANEGLALYARDYSDGVGELDARDYEELFEARDLDELFTRDVSRLCYPEAHNKQPVPYAVYNSRLTRMQDLLVAHDSGYHGSSGGSGGSGKGYLSGHGGKHHRRSDDDLNFLIARDSGYYSGSGGSGGSGKGYLSGHGGKHHRRSDDDLDLFVARDSGHHGSSGGSGGSGKGYLSGHGGKHH